jgi:hypothetical protein
MSISDAIRTASQSWPYYPPVVMKERDTNTVDLFHIAETIRKICHLELGNPSLSTDKVLQIVALINTEVIGQCPLGIRNTDANLLTNILNKAGAKALEFHPEFGSIEKAIMKSLFLWFGCIQIDKSCRRADAYSKPFNKDHSMGIHAELVEISKQNPWVKTGVISAKSFETTQQVNKTYDWIPADSPYWK